jgi:hypothetical protein
MAGQDGRRVDGMVFILTRWAAAFGLADSRKYRASHSTNAGSVLRLGAIHAGDAAGSPQLRSISAMSPSRSDGVGAHG